MEPILVEKIDHLGLKVNIHLYDVDDKDIHERIKQFLPQFVKLAWEEFRTIPAATNAIIIQLDLVGYLLNSKQIAEMIEMSVKAEDANGQILEFVLIPVDIISW